MHGRTEELGEIPEISFRINDPRIQEDEKSNLVFRHNKTINICERVLATLMTGKFMLVEFPSS